MSMSCTKIDWRVGVSKALQMPRRNVRTASCAMVMIASPVSTARTAVRTPIELSTTISIRRPASMLRYNPARACRPVGMRAAGGAGRWLPLTAGLFSP